MAKRIVMRVAFLYSFCGFAILIGQEAHSTAHDHLLLAVWSFFAFLSAVGAVAEHKWTS